MINEYKIMYIPPSGTTAYCQHTWVTHVDDTCVGHIHMQVEANETIKFLDAWVHEDHRRKGVFRSLWDSRCNYVQREYLGYNVYAWCKPASLPLLLEKGFEGGDTCTYVQKRVTAKGKIPFEQCFVSC